MIDLTKKWKTRDGEPVAGLALITHGEELSGHVCGKNWAAWAMWCPDTGENLGPVRKPGWDLVPDEDEPARGNLAEDTAEILLKNLVVFAFENDADAEKALFSCRGIVVGVLEAYACRSKGEGQ